MTARCLILLLAYTLGVVLGADPAEAVQAESAADTVERGCGMPAQLRATHPVDDPFHVARVADLAGHTRPESRMILRPSRNGSVEICMERGPFPWAQRVSSPPAQQDLAIDFLPATWFIQGNTAYPRGRNLGAIWAGRGVSSELRAGVNARWGAVSAGFAPRVIFQQNTDFQTMSRSGQGYSPFAHPWHSVRIDWPQRFGDRSFWTIDPGQSFLRVDGYGVGIGVSTENLWWGPALVHPIVLSSNAPGFPHAFLETSAPITTPIGRLEGQMIWGHLSESDYWDSNRRKDRRLLAGIALTYEPRWVPGLFFGLSRAYIEAVPPGGLGFRSTFIEPYRNLRENTVQNQLASLFARWVHPASGFEVYLEYARDDHWENFRTLLMMPGHSRAYMAGFQHVRETRRGLLRVYGELIDLTDPLPIRHSARRGPVYFYTNSTVRQGYTHRGQLLGAAIGPGSDAQTLGADLLTERGGLGFFLERTRYDGDMYLTTWSRSYGHHNAHDLELTAGIHHLLFLSRFDLRSGIAYSYRQNRHFIGLNRSNPRVGDGIAEGNWAIQLELRWQPERLRVPAAAQVGPRDDG